MAFIETIKQRILELDPGSFQNLCDSYLYKMNYLNMVSLGGEAGTRKTTSGTPDTYFIESNGKYIFVEYTTQKNNLFAKIRDDLGKCLDTSKTDISHDNISEIIYCHTSSDLAPSKDSELKALCENAGIKLTLIGIDKIAEDIYLFHQNLSRDFLGVPINSGQIQSYDDFINSYNANRLAAPIDTEFLFREKEVNDICDAFQRVDVVILSGSAGTGKTRLALHYVKNCLKMGNEQVYCIRSNALPIYDDLKIFINKPGNYFLFVDDANQLSGLQHIIHYTTKKSEGYNVKILITVRDYALQKVTKDIKAVTSYEIVDIDVFSDNEIIELLKSSLNILNPDYHERIIRIAEGNARIAILAGKVAKSSNHLETIDDVSQLYEDYYGSTLEDNQFLVNSDLCISAGVIAFLEAVYFDHIDALLPILQEKGLNRTNFIENIYMLHEQEIVDIYNDKVARFSDQCLSNYLLKYVFFDKKLLSLSDMTKVCFQNYRERTVSSINTLLNIFKNETLFRFVEKEINVLWDELSEEKSPLFFEFVKVFFRVNPTETLLLLQNKIESEEKVVCEWSDIDTEKRKNYQDVDNDIISILGGFANMSDFPSACELFFQYYLKRPDLFVEFYHAVNRYFGINKDSFHNDFFTQITFFEQLKEYSDGWRQELVSNFFLEIAEEFLKLCFSPAEAGRKNQIVIYHLSLNESEGVQKYRGLVWESLLSLCKKENYREKVRTILNAYGGTVEDISIPVLQFDLKYINEILQSYFPPNELKNSLLVNRIEQVFKRKKISCESMFNKYFEDEKFQLYALLTGMDDKDEVEYNKWKNIKQQSIIQYVSSGDFEEFKKLIDVCSEISVLDDDLSWEFGEGLGIAFDAISDKKDCYVDAIKYYIEKDTPMNLQPCPLVGSLFSLLGDKEVYQIIALRNFSQKNSWLYAYYHELPPEIINSDHLQGLYNFLQNTSDRDIISSPGRDVDFLEKYSVVDKQALIKGSEYILAKMEYSPFIVQMYFGLLFNRYHNTPQEVFLKYDRNFGVLEKIYYAMLSCDHHFDYDGQFLKELYLVRPSILDKYISYLISKQKCLFSNHQERNRCFFYLDDFEKIYNKIFEQLVENCQVPISSVPYFLESLLLPVQNEEKLIERQDTWIRQCIQLFFDDKIKMYCLFSVISKLKIERKKEYVLLFLENNSLFEDFGKIPLTPTSWECSGSVVPMYSDWIDYLKSLLPNLSGLKWLKHKKYIEREIKYLEEKIESEQIKEILRG